MSLEEALFRSLYIFIGCIAPTWLLIWVTCRKSTGGIAVFTTIVIGNLAIMTNAWWIQGGQPALSLSDIVHYGSYAAIFDVFLAVAWGTQAYARRHVPLEISKERISRAYAVGLIVGVSFHYIIGGPSDSQSPDMGVRMHDSATSWAHNFGVMPAMVTIFICYLPHLRKLWITPGKRRYAVVSISGLLLYGIGLGLDQWRLRLPESHPWRLDVHWLDVPGVDWQDCWSRYLDLWQLIVNLF